MKRLFIASFVAASAVAYPAYAGAATVKGVVVGASAARGTIAVASTRGAVHTLHVAKLVRVGTRVTATAASRADGTFTASHVTVRGRATGRSGAFCSADDFRGEGIPQRASCCI